MERVYNSVFAFISIIGFWHRKNRVSITKNIFNKGILFKAPKVIEINTVYGTDSIPWIYRVIMKHESDKTAEVQIT